MITPSFALTATERVLPRMALDFTTAVLDSRVTFTRAGNTATVTNSSGVIAAINADLPRFDFDPITLVCKGLLIEELRTNLLLNSLLNGTNLSTQLVTTTAAVQTLSFYGTGQIVLTGTASATVIGTGAYPNRQTLTFTPTVGVLTLTVTGTVQYAQLEVGAFATSFIPTTGSQVTRNADVAQMTGTNFSSWYNASQGAIVAQAVRANIPVSDSTNILAISDGTSSNRSRIWIWSGNASQLAFTCIASGASQADMNPGSVTANVTFNVAGAYKLNDFATSSNAGVVVTYTSGIVPIGLNVLNIGAREDLIEFLNGHIKKIAYYPQRLTNSELQAFTK
jgi:hypothetical protein